MILTIKYIAKKERNPTKMKENDANGIPPSQNMVGTANIAYIKFEKIFLICLHPLKQHESIIKTQTDTDPGFKKLKMKIFILFLFKKMYKFYSQLLSILMQIMYNNYKNNTKHFL